MIEYMSPLRLMAIMSGIIALILSFFRLRSHADKRTDVWLLVTFGVVIILVGFFPDLINLPADILSLGGQQGGRLLTLLIVSTILLWFVTLYQRAKSEKRYYQFDDLVRGLTVNGFLSQNETEFTTRPIIVLIPAYNEADNLKEVLPRIPASIDSIPVVPIVIDDGSDDGTVDVARKYSAMVATHPVNRGGGAALKAGYDIARNLRAAVVVTMDADGQHLPDEIESLVIPLLSDKADFVIGSRVLGSCANYSRFRVLGVHMFSRLISLIIGTRITDCSSGFRALRGKVIEDCLLLQEQYHTAEVIIEAAKRDFRIVEKPVTISSRLSGESKKGHDLKYGLFFLRTIIKTWLR